MLGASRIDSAPSAVTLAQAQEAAPAADANAVRDASELSLSDDGLGLIQHFESLRLSAYPDSAGVWTIGWGHTGNVQPGDTVTRAEADALLRSDVAWAETAVRNAVDVPLTQGQFDALVSFTFNVGAGAFENSTLLERLNAGDTTGAQDQFGRWIYAGGEVLPGLVRRRAAEADAFAAAGGVNPPDL
jgi:lysozyme